MLVAWLSLSAVSVLMTVGGLSVFVVSIGVLGLALQVSEVLRVGTVLVTSEWVLTLTGACELAPTANPSSRLGVARCCATRRRDAWSLLKG